MMMTKLLLMMMMMMLGAVMWSTAAARCLMICGLRPTPFCRHARHDLPLYSTVLSNHADL